MQDVKIWAIEPPRPLKVRMYRCDKTFVTEPLKEMLEIEEVFGLLVMDRREATIGLLEGKKIEVLRRLTSGVPGKNKGRRSERSPFRTHHRRFSKKIFQARCRKHERNLFNMPRLKGILVGGPIPTKEEFLELGELVTKLKEKVIAVKDLGYTDEHGLKLLVEASQEDIAEQEIIKEKKILRALFSLSWEKMQLKQHMARNALISHSREAQPSSSLSQKN